MNPSVGTRGTFYWRGENRQAGLDHRADDLGRAWVVEADGTERKINGGDLISRAEAERLASAGEYTLDTDA